MSTVVVNKNREEYDVLIQQGTKWGNVYHTRHDLTRDEKIHKYSEYFMECVRSGKFSREELRSLYGKKLGCSCKPLKCHGDIIADYVNREFSPMINFFTKGKLNE